MSWDFYTKEGFLKVGTTSEGVGDALTLQSHPAADFILKAGDTGIGSLTLTGVGTQIVLPNDPTLGTHAVRQSYADTRYVNTAGDTITGNLVAAGAITFQQAAAPSVGNDLTNRTYVTSTFLPFTGGTLTGGLTISLGNGLNFTGVGGDITFAGATSKIGWPGEFLREKAGTPGTLELIFQGAATRAAIQVAADPVAGFDLVNLAYLQANYGTGGGNLNSLTDVVITAPILDDYLHYNGVDWVNRNATAAPWLHKTTGGSVVGKVVLQGALNLSTKLKNSNYTVDLSADMIILCDSSGGSFTITLPASHSLGDQVVVKDRFGTSGTFPITVDTFDSDTIDGLDDYILAVNYLAVSLVSDGTNWCVI